MVFKGVCANNFTCGERISERNRELRWGPQERSLQVIVTEEPEERTEKGLQKWQKTRRTRCHGGHQGECSRKDSPKALNATHKSNKTRKEKTKGSETQPSCGFQQEQSWRNGQGQSQLVPGWRMNERYTSFYNRWQDMVRWADSSSQVNLSVQPECQDFNLTFHGTWQTNSKIWME